VNHWIKVMRGDCCPRSEHYLDPSLSRSKLGIGCKWVYKVKHHGDSSIESLKHVSWPKGTLSL